MNIVKGNKLIDRNKVYTFNYIKLLIDKAINTEERIDFTEIYYGIDHCLCDTIEQYCCKDEYNSLDEYSSYRVMDGKLRDLLYDFNIIAAAIAHSLDNTDMEISIMKNLYKLKDMVYDIEKRNNELSEIL